MSRASRHSLVLGLLLVGACATEETELSRRVKGMQLRQAAESADLEKSRIELRLADGATTWCPSALKPAQLRAMGTVVWLQGEFDAVYERAQRAGARPMLAGRKREEIEALYRAREPYYRQADLTVDTTGINPDQVVAKLLLLLRDRRASILSPLGRGQAEGA